MGRNMGFRDGDTKEAEGLPVWEGVLVKVTKLGHIEGSFDGRIVGFKLGRSVVIKVGPTVGLSDGSTEGVSEG